MQKLNLPQETIQAILEYYRDKSLTTKQVYEKHGISSGTLTNIIRANGEPMRNPNSTKRHRRKNGNSKTCPHCKKKVDLKGAKYCPYCAADLRDEKELLADKLYKLLGYNSFLPENVRDEYVEVVNKTIKILNEE